MLDGMGKGNSKKGVSELDALRQAILASGEPLVSIAKRAEVRHRWLATFVAGDIPEPGYTKIRRVQRLFTEPGKTVRLQG
jgi:hypothetical protein